MRRGASEPPRAVPRDGRALAFRPEGRKRVFFKRFSEVPLLTKGKPWPKGSGGSCGSI